MILVRKLFLGFVSGVCECIAASFDILASAGNRVAGRNEQGDKAKAGDRESPFHGAFPFCFRTIHQRPSRFPVPGKITGTSCVRVRCLSIGKRADCYN